MPHETEYEKLLQAERTHLKKEEDHKALLYQRDPKALQPSKEFIEKCVGLPKSDQAIELEARANAQKKIETARQEAQHREWVRQQS